MSSAKPQVFMRVGVMRVVRSTAAGVAAVLVLAADGRRHRDAEPAAANT